MLIDQRGNHRAVIVDTDAAAEHTLLVKLGRVGKADMRTKVLARRIEYTGSAVRLAAKVVADERQRRVAGIACAALRHTIRPILFKIEAGSCFEAILVVGSRVIRPV